MKIPGKITISQRQSNAEPSYVAIEIIDNDASCEVVLAKMKLEDFAKAVTGQGHINCTLEIRQSSRIGKIREHKTERILIPQDSDRPEAEEIVKAAERDGWIGRVADAHNQHNTDGSTTGGTYYKVTFERWINREDSK